MLVLGADVSFVLCDNVTGCKFVSVKANLWVGAIRL